MTVTAEEVGANNTAAAEPSRPRTWHLFVALAAVQLALSLFLNHRVLTPELYQSVMADQAPSAQIDEFIVLTQKWQLWSYVLSPVVLALRVSVVALLVQLVLLLFPVEVPFGRVFRAALIAYSALLIGIAFHTYWLSSLPTSEINAATLELVPGSLATLLPELARERPAFAYLLNVVTLFDIAWCVFFALALEGERSLRFVPALSAVLVVWLMTVACKWGIAAYLGRLAS